jgi:hypothetical protein
MGVEEVEWRERELRKLSKQELAQMHINNGGLLRLSEYMKWTKDELVAEVLFDEVPFDQGS